MSRGKRHGLIVCILALACLCSCQKSEEDGCAVCVERPLVSGGRAFLKGDKGAWLNATDQRMGKPVPAAQKDAPAGSDIILLSDPAETGAGNMPLVQALKERRSRRVYTQESLALDDLAFLLWSTQGVTGVERDKDGNVANHFRTVPSGGARHPFETYLLINRVSGLAPGVYRYLAFEHGLVQLSDDDQLSEKARRICYGQEVAAGAAVVFVWAAVPYRTEWRYGSIAHKMIAIEAGHICQNLYLAVESIGAGMCAMLAYDQESMDELIGVDGVNEFTVYIGAVGKK